MFEKYILESEEKLSILKLFTYTTILTIILGAINSIATNNSLFLIGFIALALSYPTVNYIRAREKEEILKKYKNKILLKRHSKELIIFWTIFLATTIGFYITLLISPQLDMTYQEKFISSLSGNLTQLDKHFDAVLINNLTVTLFTFIISAIVFSGLLYIIVWNASILAYYLYQLSSHTDALIYLTQVLGHGLLEIGGYVLAGIAGSLLAYRVDQDKHYSEKLSTTFYKDFAILTTFSILLIIIAAFLECMG